MAIDIIKLNNNIRQLDGFIHDVMLLETDANLVLSANSLHAHKSLVLHEKLTKKTYPDGTTVTRFNYDRDEDGYYLVPKTTISKNLYTDLSKNLVVKNDQILKDMDLLKAWGKKKFSEKTQEEAADIYKQYLSVIASLKKHLTEQNFSNYRPYTFMDNPNNCIIEDEIMPEPAATAPATATPTKRRTFNPIGVAVSEAVIYVLLLACATMVDYMISSISSPGSLHVAPFLLNMPGLAIVGGIIGALSITRGVWTYAQNRAARQVAPSLNPDFNNPFAHRPESDEKVAPPGVFFSRHTPNTNVSNHSIEGEMVEIDRGNPITPKVNDTNVETASNKRSNPLTRGIVSSFM